MDFYFDTHKQNAILLSSLLRYFSKSLENIFLTLNYSKTTVL